MTTTPPRPPRDHRPAPWVRTRLRTAPLAVLLTAALAFAAVLLAAALPRALDRGADSAVREFLGSRGPHWTSVTGTAAHRYDAAELDRVAAKLSVPRGETFTFDADDTVYGTSTNGARRLANPGLTRLSEADPVLSLVYLHGITRHGTLVEGTWPADGGDRDGPIPIAVSAHAAAGMGIRLGDLLSGDAGDARGGQSARVVGVFRPDDRDDPYWTALPCPEKACIEGNESLYWKTSGIVHGDALNRLPDWNRGATDFWRIPVDLDGLRADRLRRTAEEIGSYVSGPAAVHLSSATGRSDLRLGSELPSMIHQALTRQAAVAPIAAIGPAGLVGVAALVLCLAAALTADRRAAELLLLRARGASRGGTALRLLGEGAVTVLPAAALATALAFWLLPTPRWTASVVGALATTLLALLAFPARAAVLGRPPRAPGSRRRLVGELALLVVTVAAALTVRRRGVNPTGEGVDLLLVTAPILLALSGALLLARLQPLLVGAFARAAGRRRGAVGFLGLVRAARGSGSRTRPSVLPMVALMLAVTTASVGATVLDTVEGARLRAARALVGGDASVSAAEGLSLPAEFTRAAGALPGVELATSVWWESEAFLLGGGDRGTRVHVVAVDPSAYAEIARTVDLGRFDPAVLAAGPGGPDTPVPALFSTTLAKELADGVHRLRMPNGWELHTTEAGTLDRTPALDESATRFAVVSLEPALARLPYSGSTNVWLALGDVDDRQLKGLMRGLRTFGGAVLGPASDAPADEAPYGYVVRSSTGLVAELAGDPLQRSAERLFWASVLGAGGFALLAVLLTLLRAAPERVALLARLRTMGLRPRQGLALILAEALPQALVAALGGGLAALAAVALLGPAIDLGTLVGAPVDVVLRPAVPPVALQVAALTAVICTGVLLEALVSGRRQIGTELRVGDQR
ncbi:hypothetical protein ACWGB8_36880 [Kitasatospora sp. NPDC054939]